MPELSPFSLSLQNTLLEKGSETAKAGGDRAL